jgi:hypothetical protein
MTGDDNIIKIKSPKQPKAEIETIKIPNWKNYQEIIIHSLKGSSRAFFITCSIKSLVTMVLRLIRKKISLYHFKDAISSSLPFAKMVGSFTLIWKLVSNILYFHTKRVSKLNGCIAGSLASLSLLFETRQNRVTYVQQFFMRSMQAGKNAMKYRDIPTVPHGDSIIFAFSCASILYAYAFRPDSLPRVYYQWMLKKAMVPKAALIMHAEHNTLQEVQGQLYKVDVEKIKNVLLKTGASPANTKRMMAYVKENNGSMPGYNCASFHPKINSCSKHAAYLFSRTFCDMIPVYGALNLIPLIFFKPMQLIKRYYTINLVHQNI